MMIGVTSVASYPLLLLSIFFVFLTGRSTPALRACASGGTAVKTAGNANPAPTTAAAAL